MNMTIPVDALMILSPAKELKTIITAKELTIIPAKELKTIPAKELMMMMKNDDILQTQVSHVQLPKNGEKYHVKHDDNTLCKMVYGPTYVPYNEDGQKLLLPQTTDMSRKDNLKLLYNSLPEGMCDNEYESLEQAVNDVETFQYSHETSTKTCTSSRGLCRLSLPSHSRY